MKNIAIRAPNIKLQRYERASVGVVEKNI